VHLVGDLGLDARTLLGVDGDGQPGDGVIDALLGVRYLRPDPVGLGLRHVGAGGDERGGGGGQFGGSRLSGH